MAYSKEQHKEKNPGTGYYKERDPGIEHQKGDNPDQKIPKNPIPDVNPASIKTLRWEH
jgi:hypothetical protein